MYDTSIYEAVAVTSPENISVLVRPGINNTGRYCIALIGLGSVQ
jgi:hypothetical protein